MFRFALCAAVWHFVGVPSAQQRFWPDPQPLVERLGRAFFRQLPECPGVYLMHGTDDLVLYVGKAKSLRHRLANYRVANPERMPRRTLRLLRLVRRIAWEECADEQTALRRESELLLSLRPRFNRAGVWPGQKRFLVWRALPDGLALAVTVAPEEGWRCAGPMGGQAIPLHRALVRLLWFRLHPDRGLAGMPSGWFRGAHGGHVLIPTRDRALTEEAATQLADVLGNTGGAFQRWLAPPVSPFELSCWQEDLLSVCESSQHRG